MEVLYVERGEERVFKIVPKIGLLRNDLQMTDTGL